MKILLNKSDAVKEFHYGIPFTQLLMQEFNDIKLIDVRFNKNNGFTTYSYSNNINIMVSEVAMSTYEKAKNKSITKFVSDVVRVKKEHPYTNKFYFEMSFLDGGYLSYVIGTKIVDEE